jgi:tRNA pseudouridine55 synthase
MGRRRHQASGPDAVLLVDKPAGISSAAVVARVRRAFGGVKAGHTGTLDPFATGLLPVCLSEATKLASVLTDADKSYEGRIRLGVTSDTHDRTGIVSAAGTPPIVDDGQLEELAARWSGWIEQVPPVFSAIKSEGTPMYERARRGETPEIAARRVRVDRLELRADGDAHLFVSIDCSKGFYVRSLARDLGEALGCGAILDSLRRTRVGGLDAEGSVPLEKLETGGDPAAAAGEALLSMDEALARQGLRLFEIPSSDAAALRLGRQEPLRRLGTGADGEKVRLSTAGRLVAIASFERGLWHLDRVVAAQGVTAPCPAFGIVLAPPVSQLEEEERNEANRRD